MKQERDVKGLSRRMLCKLVAGGAVAIGGSCLFEYPFTWKLNGQSLLGVLIGGSRAGLSQVSILARGGIKGPDIDARFERLY